MHTYLTKYRTPTCFDTIVHLLVIAKNNKDARTYIKITEAQHVVYSITFFSENVR